MRHALFVAGLALVAGTAAGCGGGAAPADAPADASREDFCGVFDEFLKDVRELGEDAETADQVKALKDTGERLEEVGTPEDMPEDARQGFELTVQAIAELPDDATDKELDQVQEDFSEEEQEQSDAFDEYLAEACPRMGS
jgi:hypothetical protein